MPELTPEQRTKLDNNIKMMLSKGATPDDVKKYASDFNEQFSVKKKEPSDVPSMVGSIGGQLLSEAQSQSQKRKLTDYVKSISNPATKELSTEAKRNTIASTQGVKPFDAKHPYSEDKLNHDAGQKVADVFLSNDERYKDPFKYLNSDMSVSSERDLLVNDRARNMLAGELMPTGYDAKQVLNNTHLGGEPDNNTTKQYLQNAAAKYDNTVQDLKAIPQQLNQPNANAEFYDYNTTPLIESAAIKWRAKNDKSFADELRIKGVNPDDPNTLDEFKLGQTLNAYLQNPDVQTYFNKENPSLLNAAKRASETLLTKNREYGRNVVANEVSQAVQKAGYNNIDPIFNYYGENHKQYADMVAKDLYRDNPEKLQLWNGIKDNQEDYIDAPSFFQKFAEVGGQTLKGIPKTLAAINDPYQSSVTTSKDIQDRWNKEANNVSANPEGLSKYIADFGGLAGLISSVAATGNLTGISNPTTANMVATGLDFLGNELDAGKEKYPNNPLLAFMSGAGNTAMYMALSSDLFPGEKAKAAFQDVKPEVSKVMEQLTSGAITREAARKEMNTIAKKAIDLAGGTLTKSAKASLEMTGMSAVNRMLDGVFMDNENFQKFHPDDELVKTLGNTFLSFLPVSALGKIGEMKQKSQLAKESYYAMAERPKYYESVINELAAKDPSINKEELLSNLNLVASLKGDLDAQGIPEVKQKKLIYNELLKKVAIEQAPKTPESTLLRLHDEKIRGLDKENERILNEQDEIKQHQDNINEASGVLSKINNAEYINEHELNSSADKLYDILDKVEKSGISDEHKSSLSNLIEPLINKIESYEFRTKTQIGTVTEKVPTGRTAKSKIRNEKPVLEGSEGKPITITDSSGKSVDGVLRIENGNYVVYNEEGDKVSVIGEKALTDLYLKLPDENVLESPISFDKDGNVKSVTFQTKDGKLVEIKDKDKALDLAIRLQADALGEVPDTIFQPIYEDVVKEVPYEVLASTGEPIKQNNGTPASEKTSETTPEPDSGKTSTEGEQLPPEPPSPPNSTPTTPEGDEQSNLSGITHEATKDTRKEFGLEEPYKKTPTTEEDINAKAEEAIKSGYNIEKLLTQLESGVLPNGVETFILKKYKAGLEAEIIKDPSDENLDKLRRLVKASDSAGSGQGLGLWARKGFDLRDDSLAGFFTTEQDVNLDAPLTESQKETVKKEWQQINDAKAKFEEYMAKKEQELAQKKADIELNKTKKEAKKTKKTHQEHVEYRKKVIDDIHEKLRKARGESNVTVVPYAKELFTIAPDVARIVKDLVEEGVTKLSDIVDSVHETLKDAIPGIHKKDIYDIIAGEYNEKKKTKNEVAKQLFELRQQAKLINEYDKLNSGIEPKLEKKKIQRNQQLESLRKQIKEHNLTRIAEYKQQTKKQIEELEKELPTAETPAKNPTIKLDAEGQLLKQKLIKAKRDREIRLLKQEYQNRSKYKKAQDWVIDKLNIPRTLMASMDYSAPLRQGIVAAVAHPRTAGLAQIAAFKASFSPKYFDRWFYDIKEMPRYETAMQSDLALTDPHSPFLTAKEEAFMNNTAEKIPIVGKLIQGSERAYVMFLNKMRWDLFNRFADRLEEKGMTYSNSPKEYKKLAEYINNQTGRGSLNKNIESAAPILNTLFFAPRLIASRLNLLNPAYYAKLPKDLRVMAAKDMFKFIGLGMTVLALAKLNGSQVDDDPRSSDFGKIKQGNTRWDIWGGFQQYIRLFTQFGLGQRKSTSTGKIQNLDGKGAFGTDRTDVLKSFLRGKLAPVPSMGVDFLSGRTTTGEQVTLKNEAKSHLLPLLYSDIKQSVDDRGVKSLFDVGIPAIFGVGVQTYTPKPVKEIKNKPQHQK